jgi:general secretion pathway protein D
MNKSFYAMHTKQLRRSLLAVALLASLGTAVNQTQAQGFGGFGGQNTANRSTSSRSAASYPSSTQMGTATVSVDPETRRVFVVTDDDTAEYVKQVVQDLDRPTPQVLIKCVFLEATYTKDSDIGVDGTYKHTISGSSIKELNGNYIATTPASAFQAAAGAATYGFSSLSGDLQVTLSALAKAGKTEILSRPSILARNNQPATISLGQQVPLITNTRFDNFGNQINSVSYQNVGIILSVTPFITSDGMVEMVVAPETSELADKSQWVPISSGGTNNAGSFSAPVINSRSADTVVVVPDGQTVVIGGLMQSKKLNSETKVPILGDIPLLGLLFKHKVTSNGKTELMIFMTPHIVKFPADLAALTSSERGKQNITQKAFTEEDLNRYLDNLPAVEDPKAKKK